MKKQQMESVDARINVGFPGHPKTKILLKRHGAEAVLRLVYLILWARSNRSDGNLSGMSDEEIELAVDWPGATGVLMTALHSSKFVDGDEGFRKLHDWSDHQPWATGSHDRRERATWSSLVRHHGAAEAARRMPDYAKRLRDASDEKAKTSSEDANSMPKEESSNAPSPILSESSPSPSPSHKNTPVGEDAPDGAGDEGDPDPTVVKVVGDGGEKSVVRKRKRKAATVIAASEYSEAFEAWWLEYPDIRKTDKRKCYERWKAADLAEFADILIEDLMRRTGRDGNGGHFGWVKDDGAFIPAPLVYLRNERWNDPVVPPPQLSTKRKIIESGNDEVLAGWANKG